MYTADLWLVCFLYTRQKSLLHFGILHTTDTRVPTFALMRESRDNTISVVATLKAHQ